MRKTIIIKIRTIFNGVIMNIKKILTDRNINIYEPITETNDLIKLNEDEKYFLHSLRSSNKSKYENMKLWDFTKKIIEKINNLCGDIFICKREWNPSMKKKESVYSIDKELIKKYLFIANRDFDITRYEDEILKICNIDIKSNKLTWDDICDE